MKKIILFIFTLIIGLMVINVKAEENYYDEFNLKIRNLNYMLGMWDEKLYFSENEKINPEIIWDYMIMMHNNDFSSYLSGEDEYGNTEFKVPQNVFEDEMKLVFNIDEKYLEDVFRKYNTYDQGKQYKEIDGKYYYTFVRYNGMGFISDTTTLIGYKDLQNNYYETYSYLTIDYTMTDECYENELFCKPNKSEIYGKEYIINTYKYFDENNNLKYSHYAEKIIGYIKSKIYFDGENVKYMSFEQINKNEVPSRKELTTQLTSSIAIDEEEYKIGANEGVFVEGTKITIEKQTEGKIFDLANKVLKDKANKYVIYEINAKVGEYNIEPNGVVKVQIKVPKEYKNPVVYYIDEKGNLEKIETKVDVGYAVVDLSHFSTYALIDEEKKVETGIGSVISEDAPKENVVENPKTGLIGASGLLLIAIGGTTLYLNLKKKSKFPQS